jgi:two-component system, NarL family, sensor kinase
MQQHTKPLLFLILIAIIFFVAMIVIFIILMIIFQQKKVQQINKTRLLEKNFTESLLQTQLEIQEQTLRTISQEIHDNVGQVLSLAKLNLSTLHFSEGEQKENKINSASRLVAKAINDLRDLTRSMNGDKIADLGLKDATDNELKIIQNTGQFAAQLIITGEPYKLIPQNEMVVFRIVQESLNNIVKHSKAQNIIVNISYSTEMFKIKITDDGKGFDADGLEATQTGIGLNNMKNRATLIGARFCIQSAPLSGTSVFVELDNKPYKI